ncbi:hypothetical protein B1199_01160 [Pseudoalteromonas ulvae]|uniref:Uncharacterized protein n=1 Tax=Pseudoalteromonas ulvae TaxID=107327 RepID=A0A244CTH0_PSEDV|nr:hypothetical protein B1199_01160 [Pseudoalteromonas ulvae]
MLTVRSFFLRWCSVVLFALPAHATVYPLPDNGRLIGEPIFHRATHGDYFQNIAEQYNVGFLALMAANPDLDPLFVKADTVVTIPSQMILPQVPQRGIVVNLPELRLYYFEPSGQQVYVYPIGMGQPGLRTPVSTSTISEKRTDPSWVVPESLKQRYLTEQGIQLPDVMPPGSTNPLGRFAMRLGSSEYLIHGSNQRFGIGMSVSSGCLRLFDADIEELFSLVTIGTPVRIIDHPVKISYEANNARYVEIHSPLSDSTISAQSPHYHQAFDTLIKGQNDPQLRAEVTHNIAKQVTLMSGLPVNVVPSNTSSTDK